MSDLQSRIAETQLSYARRMRDHLRDGTSDLAEGPMRNDVSVYLDPERHAAERRLMREVPVIACTSSDLPEPGCWRLFDETGVPVVVVRDPDGEVRAFLNICTHRAARLVREPEGRAKLFTCWFHGWSFDTRGDLRAAPEAERFEGALAERSHLVSVPAAERYGLVFVQATPGSSMDIDAHLGALGPQLELLQIENATRVKDGVLPVAANWKFALDTYGEGYHFAALHKATLAPYFRSDVTIYDRYGPHHKVGFASRASEALLDAPEAEWEMGDGVGGIHYIFPNTILFAGSVRPGSRYYTLFRHFPGETPGEAKTYKAIYSPASVEDEEKRREVEDAYDATAHVVTTEDYVVAAEGWRNLAALPAGSTVVYGRQEIALQNVHKAIAQAIGIPLPETASSPAPMLEAAE